MNKAVRLWRGKWRNGWYTQKWPDSTPGTWYPDDGNEVERRFADQSVAVIERLELACRHEAVEEIFMLNVHPELYAAVADARALLIEIAKARGEASDAD